MRASHRIKRLEVVLNVSDQRTARDLQQAISIFCRDTLPHILQNTFDAVASDQLIRIERLELTLPGFKDAVELQARLGERLQETLRYELGDAIAASAVTVGSANPIDPETPVPVQFDADYHTADSFIHVLQHGVVPWHAAGSDFDDFVDSVVRLLQKEPVFRAQLAVFLTQPGLPLQRFIRQVPLAAKRRIVALITGIDEERIDNGEKLLNVFSSRMHHRFEIPADMPMQLKERFWRALLQTRKVDDMMLKGIISEVVATGGWLSGKKEPKISAALLGGEQGLHTDMSLRLQEMLRDTMPSLFAPNLSRKGVVDSEISHGIKNIAEDRDAIAAEHKMEELHPRLQNDGEKAFESLDMVPSKTGLVNKELEKVPRDILDESDAQAVVADSDSGESDFGAGGSDAVDRKVHSMPDQRKRFDANKRKSGSETARHITNSTGKPFVVEKTTVESAPEEGSFRNISQHSDSSTTQTGQMSGALESPVSENRHRQAAPPGKANAEKSRAGASSLASVQHAAVSPGDTAESTAPVDLSAAWPWMTPYYEEFHVTNAGLVLLAPFFGMVFKDLNYLDEERKFSTPAACMRAVIFSQALVTSEPYPAECDMTLNKILCGLAADALIERFIDLNQDEHAAVREVLDSAIRHWRILKRTSVPVFQETFLKHAGILTKKSGSWRLKIERTAVDVLIDTLPWTISVIKHPWMAQPIMVEW